MEIPAQADTPVFHGNIAGSVNPPLTQTLVCNVGDSIGQLVSYDNSTFTSGSAGNYPTQTVADLGNRYQSWNMGSPGAKAQDLINRIINQTNVLPATCDVVIIEDGTNDTSPLLPSGDPTTAYNTYQTLVNDIVAAEPSTTKFVFITVRQYGASCSNISPCSTISTWNTKMKATAAALGSRASVLDMETDSKWYVACSGTNVTIACFPDNTHPNQAAAALIASNLSPLITALAPSKSAPGQSTMAANTVSDQGSANTVITAPIGRNLVLQPGQCAIGSASSCYTNVWVNGINGNDGQLCVGDSRGNCLAIRTAGITIPQQYSGASPPFIQTSGASELDFFTPMINFKGATLQLSATSNSSQIAPNGANGLVGTGTYLIQSASNSGFNVKDLNSGGVYAGMIPGDTASGFTHDLVWYDAANSTAMAYLGDGTTSGSFTLVNPSASFIAPNGFVASNANTYTPQALSFGTGGVGYYTTVFNVASGRLVQGVTPTVWGVQYGVPNSQTPVLALDGNGNLGTFGKVQSNGVVDASLTASAAACSDGSKNIVSTCSGVAPAFGHNACSASSGNPCSATVTCSITASTTCTANATVPASSICTATANSSDTTTGTETMKMGALSTNTQPVIFTVSASQTTTAAANVTCL